MANRIAAAVLVGNDSERISKGGTTLVIRIDINIGQPQSQAEAAQIIVSGQAIVRIVSAKTHQFFGVKDCPRKMSFSVIFRQKQRVFERVFHWGSSLCQPALQSARVDDGKLVTGFIITREANELVPRLSRD